MDSFEGAQFGANEKTNSPRQPKYLARRRGIFWFKRKVPRDAKKAFPRAKSGTVWLSLRTQDEEEARHKLREVVENFERSVAKARVGADLSAVRVEKAKLRMSGTGKYLLPEHVPVILEAYQAEVLHADVMFRAQIGIDGTRSIQEKLQALAARQAELQSRLTVAKQGRMLQLVEVVSDEASRLLKEHGLIAPPYSTCRQEFTHELLRVEIALLEEQLLRMRGEGQMKTPGKHVAARRARALVTLRCAWTDWAKGQARAKTVDTFELHVAEFEAQAGPLPLVGISTTHAEKYRDWLLAKRVRRETAKNRIGNLATLFAHAVAASRPQDAHVGLPNPFRAVSLKQFAGKTQGEVRRPFTESELKQLFLSELYTRGYQTRGQAREALYWCFPIGLYAGPRIEELAQMRSSDVHQVEGVWVFNFREECQDQHLKTYWSRRLVPVHPELARLGLLEYVRERQNDLTNLMLFPSLSNENKYKSWSAALSKSIGRYLDRIGLQDRRLDFHSLRYVFRQQCANCGVNPRDAERLLGHWVERDDSTGVYLTNQGLLYPLPALVNAIEAVRYSELNLTHIYSQMPLLGGSLNT